MNWVLIKHTSLGPVRFGMKRAETRNILPDFQVERKDGVLTENSMPSDNYDSFEVLFSKYDRCAAVKVTSAINVVVEGKSLFEMGWQDLIHWISESDKDVQVEENQLVSHAFGLKVQKESGSDNASEIMCFEADYFYLYKEIPLPTIASSFYLQVGFVEDVSEKGNQFDSLEHAGSKLFENTQEKGVFLWNNVPIPFNYQEDVAEIIQRITPVLTEMSQVEKGNAMCSVQTRNLEFDVQIQWEKDVVNMDSVWRKTPGNLQEVLNSELIRKVYTTKADFLPEWKMLLIQIDRAIQATNSTFKNEKEKETIRELQKLIRNIPQTGKFYQNSGNELLKSVENRNAALQLLLATVGVLVISFGIYWLVTGDYYHPFYWMKNNWSPLFIGILFVVIVSTVLSALARKKRLK